MCLRFEKKEWINGRENDKLELKCPHDDECKEEGCKDIIEEDYKPTNVDEMKIEGKKCCCKGDR